MAKRKSFLSKWEAVIQATSKTAKAHKYGAVKTVVDGITFASKAEAKRYSELKLLEKAGEIRGLVLQPWFVLCAPMLGPLAVEDFNKAPLTAERVIVAHYVADFTYEQLDRQESWGCAVWKRVVEDVKGMKTDTYRLKKRMFEAQYGLSITEIGGRERAKTPLRNKRLKIRSEAQKKKSRTLGTGIQGDPRPPITPRGDRGETVSTKGTRDDEGQDFGC